MKYAFKCVDCDLYYSKEAILIDAVCPVNGLHTILSGSLYVEITDDCLSRKNGSIKDYKAQRTDLIEYVQNNFSTMTSDQLKVAAEHFAVPKEVRDMFFTQEQQIQQGYTFHQRATVARNSRWEKGAVELYNYLDLNDAFEIGKEMHEVCFLYLNYGIEGTSEGDGEGIYDYLLATSGTSYELTGLATKSYVPVVSGITLPEIAQHMYELLKYGYRL